MLTGLEQYYWEKAGYFIRREALSPEEISSCFQAVSQLPEQDGVISMEALPPSCLEAVASPRVLNIIKDALGPGVLFHQAALQVNTGDSEWTRKQLPETNPLQAREAALLRHQDCLTVRLALGPDETLYVAPGSHVSPLPPGQEAALAADPYSDLEGSVCMRLAPGDALFYNPNLIHRTDPGPAASACALEFTFLANHHPFAAASPPTLTPDLLDRLPSALHPLFS